MRREINIELQFICREELCTGCGACKSICPTESICFYNDTISGNKAIINSNACIACGKCHQVCPIENNITSFEPIKCYAGWSTDFITRNNSASGGIATELYRFYADHNDWFVGCFMNTNNRAVLRVENKDYTAFQNSKYVYSDMSNTYFEVEHLLDEKKTVLFIGLPCQIAGIKKYPACKGFTEDSILFVDIICHGVIRPEWLIDYIHQRRLPAGRQVKHICFRDPRFGTNNFVLSLSDDNGIISHVQVDGSDAYQLAYHNGIAYRDNCYHCQFAQEKRVGDLTIADFTGVGSCAEYKHSKDNISCVIANTNRGLRLLQALAEENYIQIDERPLKEEYDREQRLHCATPYPKERTIFLNMIKDGISFTDAIHQSMRIRIIKNKLKHLIKQLGGQAF